MSQEQIIYVRNLRNISGQIADWARGRFESGKTIEQVRNQLKLAYEIK